MDPAAAAISPASIVRKAVWSGGAFVMLLIHVEEWPIF
jgi:hypothetical protein